MKLEARIYRPRPVATRCCTRATGGRARVDSRQRAARIRRGGFTLLEIILALALSLILFAALYTAVRVNLTTAATGPEVAQKIQVARAVLDRLQSDLRATLAPPAATPAATSETSTSTAGTSTSASTSTAATETTVSQYGVWGDSSQLMVFTSRHPRDLDQSEYLAAAGRQVAVSNVHRVTYFLATDNSRGDLRGQPYPLGLARQEIPAIAADKVDSGSDANAGIAATAIMAPEVSSLQFEYFDGTEWVDHWGEDAPLPPPRAIAVTISLLPPVERPEQLQQYAVGVGSLGYTWMPVYRLVVAIPTWSSEAEGSGDQGSGIGE